MEDFKFILKKAPMIIKSSINSACERSKEEIKYNKELAASNYLVGKKCV